jgi:transcriptional regulator with XRE-family HTH domain
MDISPAQIKVARALLGWSQSGLALKAGIDRPTLHELEEQNVGRQPRREAVSALRQTLEAAGIVFTEVSVTLSNKKAAL